MGIPKLFQELGRKGLNLVPVDVATIAQEPNSFFELDLFGTFFSLIHNVMSRKYIPVRARLPPTPPPAAPPPGPAAQQPRPSAQRCGYIIAEVIRNLFGSLQKVVIHIDGDRCVEKKKAYDSREAERLTILNRLDTLQHQMDQRSANGQFTSQTIISRLKRDLWRLFRFDDDDKRCLIDTLRAAGCVVCPCRTEADLCIGSRACNDGRIRYVISGDSDLLIYRNVHRVLRPLPRTRGVFTLYTKEDVLKTLDLPSPKHLELYGIVNDNDYSDNIPTLSLARNAEIIRAIHYGDMRAMRDMYINEARRITRIPIPSTYFDMAYRCFHDLLQTLPDQQHVELNEEFFARQASFQASMHLRYQVRRQQINAALPAQSTSAQAAAVQAAVQAPQIPMRRPSDKTVVNMYRPVFATLSDQQLANKFPGRQLQTLPPKDRIQMLHPRVYQGVNTKTTHPPDNDNFKPRKPRRPITQELTKKPRKKKPPRRGTARTTTATRQTDLATVRDRALRKLHPTVALTIGSIQGNMRKKDQQLDQQTSNAIRDHLRSCVDMLNELRQRVFWACALWIVQLMAACPENFLDQMLDEILDEQGFYNNLGTLIYKGRPGRVTNTQGRVLVPGGQGPTAHPLSPLASPTSTMLPASPAASVHGALPLPGTPIPTSSQQAYNNFARVTGLRPLIDDYPGLTTYNAIAMVLRQVRVAIRTHYCNAEFPEENNGTKQKQGESSIRFFFRRNDVVGKYKEFPTTGFSPSTVCLSEQALSDLMWSNLTSRAWLQAKFNIQLKGQLVPLINTNKGHLLNTMFSMGNYHGHVGLQSALPPTVAVAQATTAQTTTAQTATAAATRPATQHALRPSFFTNGLTITLLAYDTTKFMRIQTGTASGSGIRGVMDRLRGRGRGGRGRGGRGGGSGGGGDGGDGDGGDGDDDDDEDIENLLAQVDDEVEAPFAAHIPAIGPSSGCTVNWKQRSRLLENVEEVYKDPAVCAPLANAVVIGIDPGVKYSLTAAKIDPARPNDREVLPISKRFLMKPYSKFKRALDENKNALIPNTTTTISRIESLIPSFTRSTMVQYFNYLATPLGTGTNLTALRDFYFRPGYRRHTWECKKAQTACLDYGVKAILKMAGGNEGRKFDPTTQNVLLCVGLATFNPRTPSKHGALLKRLVTRA
ncbi:MAG: hypothetical protein J3Q66DRAFT_383936 [Benniella sp.]|nr:MAG: hypothetical protein J3Q66DRAFT_383936 [Benniella sp.]